MATKSTGTKKSIKATTKLDAGGDIALNSEDKTTLPVAEASADKTQFQGRGAFIVEITSVGVVVASTVVTDDGRALAMPAVFPNLTYALSQIDEMRALVIRHFEQAAQVGTQVIAQQFSQIQTESVSATKKS